MCAIPIFFSAKDKAGLRDKHDIVISDYCHSVAESTKPLTGSAIDVKTMWEVLYSNVISMLKSLRRPLRILIDISTFPRFYFGALCAMGIKMGLCESLTLFYAEGEYPITLPKQEIAFTGGNWLTIPIPGLVGEYDPGKSRFYMVSIGFEGWKTLRVVSRADPERVSILFPEPGFNESYVERTITNNQDLFDQYRIPPEQVVKAHAGDAIGAWKALSLEKLERPATENTFYLCCGTKPHSLALVLRAIVLGYPSVLYNLPGEHMVIETQPNGRFWRYDIKDITVFRNHDEISFSQ